MPDNGMETELVRGRVVELPSPTSNHGYIRGNIYWVLRGLVEPRDLGRVVTNDSGVVTERDPDSVRGPDVAFSSYTTVPPRSEADRVLAGTRTGVRSFVTG